MSLNFKITGDNSDLAKKCSESTRLLNETAKKGEKAGKDLAKAYEEAAQSVKIIENDIKSLEKQLEKVAPGKQKLELTAELNAAKKTLMEEKGALAELDSQLNLSGQAHVAMRTEIRNLKEQMSSMTEGTDEYRAALQRLGDLQDRMGDINQQGRIFADDNKNIKATMEAVSGLTGAMTAGVGTLSLFGMKSEQLAAIQTRLQAVMAITMGVQQVANVLNKDSYLSHILLVKAKDLLAAANLKLATTFHISNAAAQALMATLTLGLSAAITALIVVWQKFSSAAEREQEKLTDSIEQTRSQLQGMSDDIDFDVRVAEAAGKARSELIELRREAAKTALALADMKFDEINTKYLSGEATKEQWQSAKDMADEAFKALNKVNQDAVIAEIKDQKDLEKAQKEGNQKLLDEKQKNANDLLAAEEAAQQKINAVTIALMQEGCEKRKRLAQQQFNDEISRIDKEEQEKLLKAATPQEEQTIKNQSSSLRALATQQLMNTMFSIESQAAQERQKIREDEEQSWINYNKKFGNYQEQREAIIQDYNRKIANATTGGDKALLNKEMEQSLDELDRRMQNSATSMAQFFQESAEMSVAQIDKILNKAQSLMDYLSGTGSLSREQVISLGISEADLKNLENNADQVEALSNAIKRMRNELGSRSPFLLFKNQIQGAAEAFKNGDTAAGIEGIGNAITQFTPAIERLGNDLGNIFGSSDIADKIGGITDGLAGMGQAAAGVGQMMSGDIVGGAMAAVSGISQVVTAFEGLFGANYDKYNKAKEEYESLIDVYDRVINKQKEMIAQFDAQNAKKTYDYAKELLRASEEAARILGNERLNSGASAGSSSIGVRQWKNMSNEAWEQAKKALGDQWNQEYQSDKNRMTWLFEMTSEQLEVLQEQAPLFWAKLDDDVKDYLQSIIDCGEAAAEMKDILNESLTGISFDTLYDNFLNTLYDMNASAEDISNSMSDYIRKSLIQAFAVEQYKDKLKDWYQLWSDSLADGQISAEEQAALDDLRNSIIQGATESAALINEQFSYLNTDTQGQGSSKGFNAMSQETGEELNGRFTALQISNEEIKNAVLAVIPQLTMITTSGEERNQILAELRSIALLSNGHLEDIARYTQFIQNMGKDIAEIKRVWKK